jgi:hypothetical protein
VWFGEPPECAISHGLISGAYKLTHKSVSEDIIII